MSDKDERYTLPETLEWCRTRSGIFAYDLDVAACEESHVAPRWYDVEADGLAKEWFGNVWCNPPYSEVERWVQKAWNTWWCSPPWKIPREVKSISMLLPGNRTEQPWWQKLVEKARDGRSGWDFSSYFLPKRTRFGSPGDPKGENAGSPPFTCVLLVWK